MARIEICLPTSCTNMEKEREASPNYAWLSCFSCFARLAGSLCLQLLHTCCHWLVVFIHTTFSCKSVAPKGEPLQYGTAPAAPIKCCKCTFPPSRTLNRRGISSVAIATVESLPLLEDEDDDDEAAEDSESMSSPSSTGASARALIFEKSISCGGAFALLGTAHGSPPNAIASATSTWPRRRRMHCREIELHLTSAIDMLNALAAMCASITALCLLMAAEWKMPAA